MRPIGSIASALKFGMTSPKQNEFSASSTMNSRERRPADRELEPALGERGEQEPDRRRVRDPPHAHPHHQPPVEHRRQRQRRRHAAEGEPGTSAPSA